AARPRYVNSEKLRGTVLLTRSLSAPILLYAPAVSDRYCGSGTSQLASRPSACDSPSTYSSSTRGRFTNGRSWSWNLDSRPKSAKNRPPLSARFQGSDVVTIAASSTSKLFSVPLKIAYPRTNGSTDAEMAISPERHSKLPPCLPLSDATVSIMPPIAGLTWEANVLLAAARLGWMRRRTFSVPSFLSCSSRVLGVASVATGGGAAGLPGAAFCPPR